MYFFANKIVKPCFFRGVVTRFPELPYSRVSKYLFKNYINTSSIIFIIYFIMPNERTLHSFSFFVQFVDWKVHTCEFAEKIHLVLKTVSQSPHFYVDCMMVNTYELLYTQRSSRGHLNSVLLPSHNAWYRSNSQCPKLILFTINS